MSSMSKEISRHPKEVSKGFWRSGGAPQTRPANQEGQGNQGEAGGTQDGGYVSSDDSSTSAGGGEEDEYADRAIDISDTDDDTADDEDSEPLPVQEIAEVANAFSVFTQNVTSAARREDTIERLDA